MKKLFVGTLLVISITGYSYFSKAKTPTIPVSAPSLPSPTPENTQLPTIIPTTVPIIVRSRYKDGAYTGNVTDAFYGNVQVKTIITNGKIADIQLLQYPNDREESIQISNESIPQLKQEAIQAQSANVDIVTGATQTSQAFMQSLQSALTKAQNS